MLVLTRKLQQQIQIGENITVTILRVKGHTVRVGIEAPRDVRVVRGELPRKDVGASAEDQEATIIEARVSVTDEPADAAEEAACSSADQTAGETSAPLVTPTLPPRRVLSRLGNAPLRQIMTNAALAK
ncbi:MAG TPA: carbon storage regulator [Pirellulaceae bacterium]|nr:carbon storage regulator [Pirellulaceae bacterium]